MLFVAEPQGLCPTLSPHKYSPLFPAGHDLAMTCPLRTPLMEMPISIDDSFFRS